MRPGRPAAGRARRRAGLPHPLSGHGRQRARRAAHRLGAARAGVSKRTVYDHFGDKRSLFQ
ncbi:TetR family transcriptional regulator, partial [Streptomonospora algeriensis]